MIHNQECITKVEYNCSECNTEVYAADIKAKKCSKCGADLTMPVQNVTVTVNPLPIFATTL